MPLEIANLGQRLDQHAMTFAWQQVRHEEQRANGASPRPQMPVRLHRAWWDDGDPVGRDAIALDRSGSFPARTEDAAEP